MYVCMYVCTYACLHAMYSRLDQSKLVHVTHVSTVVRQGPHNHGKGFREDNMLPLVQAMQRDDQSKFNPNSIPA